MSGPQSRLAKLAAHFLPASSSSVPDPVLTSQSNRFHFHALSPTFFLPRAAEIEPEVSSHCQAGRGILMSSQAEAIYHVTANEKVLRRSYQETADRARGLAYYIKKHGYRRVGILCPNTPAFLESIFGIGAAGAINIGKPLLPRL